MRRFHYDCRVYYRGTRGMTFGGFGKRMAISECKRLLAMSNELGRPTQYAVIYQRPRGVQGHTPGIGIRVVGFTQKTVRLPVVWRGDSRQFRFRVMRVK